MAKARDMMPVTQSRVGEDGTCFRACIASILEVPEKRVPDFGAFGNDESWWDDIQDWLAKAGLEYKRIPIDGAKPVGYSTIEGISPRGGMHACVAYNGKLVHDPHPQDGTGRGLVEPMFYGVFTRTGRSKAADALYHGTTKEAANSIMAQGLKMPRGGIYVTSDKSYAERAAIIRAEETGSKQPVLLTLRPEAAKFFDEGVAALHESSKRLLPAKFIEKVTPVRTKGTDRADMMQLRANTKKQGGPFLAQVFEKDGTEHTVPTKALVTDSDTSKGYECKTGCGTRVERRYKNSYCQKCLADSMRKRETYLKPFRAAVESARGTIGYRAAAQALKEAERVKFLV